MSWYYTRESGPEGQIVTDEGTPRGVSLTQLLDAGPLPIRVAMEAIAFLADILTIAEEDEVVHGDLKPGDVYIDASGGVTLTGYGTQREGGRAPEGNPVGVATDTYGLGVVLHAVLSNESLGVVPRDRDGHDDAIVGRLLDIDWGEMRGRKWTEPLLHFLCSMLAFEPAERPEPLDVANILSEVAPQVPGESLGTWAARFVSGEDGWALDTEEAPTDEEDLGGPQALGRVLSQTGMYSRRQAASTKGECTAFWSRDKIAAMLEDGEDALADSPMAGRHGRPDASSPSRSRVAEGPSLADYPKQRPWSPDSTFTGKPDNPQMKSALDNLRRSFGDDAAKVARETMNEPQVAARTPVEVSDSNPPPRPAPSTRPSPPPVVTVGNAPPDRTSPAPDRAATKSFPWLWVILGAVAAMFMIGMMMMAGIVYYLMNRDVPPPEATQAIEVAPDPEPAAEPEPEAAPEPPARPRTSRRSSSRSRSTPRTDRSRSSSRTPAPAPAPAPSAIQAFTVRFRSMDAEAQLTCGDGQSLSFVGTTRRSFTDITTCRVNISGVVGAVQVRRDSTVTCTVVGSAVSCTGA